MLEKGLIMSFADIADLNKIIDGDITQFSEDAITEIRDKFDSETSDLNFVPADSKIYNIPQLKKDLIRDKKLINLLLILLPHPHQLHLQLIHPPHILKLLLILHPPHLLIFLILNFLIQPYLLSLYLNKLILLLY